MSDPICGEEAVTRARNAVAVAIEGALNPLIEPGNTTTLWKLAEACADAAIQAYTAALREAGYVIVPREPAALNPSAAVVEAAAAKAFRAHVPNAAAWPAVASFVQEAWRRSTRAALKASCECAVAPPQEGS